MQARLHIQARNKDVTHGNEDEGISLVVRRLVYGQVEDQPRHHNIFKTRCIDNQRVYDVIIDSWYSEDFFSKTMVHNLQLKIEKHTIPCKIG